MRNTQIQEKKGVSANDSERKPEGKMSSWFKRKRPLIGALATCLGLAGASIFLSSERDSFLLSQYKQGELSIEQLPVNDKLKAWKFTIMSGDLCGSNFNNVVAEMDDTYFDLLRQGKEADAKRVFELREFLTQNQLSRNEDPRCAKSTGKK